MEPRIVDEGFKTVLRIPLPEKEGLNGMVDLRRASQFQIGVGDRAMKVDRTGQWLGGNRFDDAPFSVDIDGNVTAESISLSSSVNITSANGLNQDFTNSTPTDLTGSAFTIILERQLRVFITATASGWIAQNGVGDFVGNGVIALYVGGSERSRSIVGGGVVGTDNRGGTIFNTLALHQNILLAAGTYSVSLRGHCDLTTNSPKFRLYRYDFSLITLGTT